MPNNTVNFTLTETNRAQMRLDLISRFMTEQPGSGTGDLATRYTYNVESLGGNYTVYLKRPTRLNKGFDFTVNISGLSFMKNRRYSHPEHDDIIKALSECKNNFSAVYQNKIKPKIQDIYDCKKVNLTSLSGATFTDYLQTRHPIEIILLAIKWLFMEQDCAYWNYSGRAMFYNKLRKYDLV